MTNAISTYMQDDKVKNRFIELMGERNAAAYITSVLLAVANSDKLQECTPQSIHTCALRAATLRLSVDPGLGQAYLVPFRDKGVPKAVLITGYKGLYDMAIRTGKYRYINVNPLYEGETLDIDRITGYAKLGGGRTGDAIIGYFGAFEMMTGFFKVIYMPIEEIDAHGARYSKTYGFEDGFWRKEHDKMCRKTVLRTMLRKWGYFEPGDMAFLEEVEAEANNVVEGETTEVPEVQPEPEPAKPQMEVKQAVADLGFQMPVNLRTTDDIW